jgi:hypothetical protein
MEFTYDAITSFMQNYFKDFIRYSPRPETTYRMHDYFAPDLEFVPYVAGNRCITGRDDFLRLLSSHPSSLEKLTPEDIMVDEKCRTAVVLIKAEICDSDTGEVLVNKHYLVSYQLTLDEKDTIKIKKILFFEEILPPGKLDIADVFGRDPAMRSLFSE